ncbi:hypothetical protein Goklo_016234 [Gossypium klotzschianum]|uniref:RNase H type-1 domain-containing protein n=1 Tax=Gossypium klotzschianum TaxID=34286 RepID=A0A7J8UE27_9ROSI|nr:hypothetical protein [Gossypium klotzschianum]
MKRNKWVHERGSQDELFTVNFIKNYIRELDDLGRILPKKCGAMKWWKSPRNACVKVNFNATYRTNEESLCSSILLRDSRGRVIASKITFHKNITAEVVACAMALKMCLDLNTRSLEVEGDFLILANEGIKQRTEIFLMNDVPEFAEAMVEVDRRWIEAQNEKPQ